MTGVQTCALPIYSKIVIETYIKIIVIDLIIVKLIRSLSRGFSLQRERVFHINFVFLCVIVVLDC